MKQALRSIFMFSLCGFASAAIAGPIPGSPGPHVSPFPPGNWAVTVSVSPRSSTYCPKTFTFTALFRLPAARHYHWVRSDGVVYPTPPKYLVAPAGQSTSTDTWTLSATYSGWEGIQLQGSSVVSKAPFSLNCERIRR